MTKRRTVGPSFPMEDYQRTLREHSQGHEANPGGREPPAATRETSRPFTETPQRKPYLPVEDTSTPSVDDGVSFRQKL